MDRLVCTDDQLMQCMISRDVDCIIIVHCAHDHVFIHDIVSVMVPTACNLDILSGISVNIGSRSALLPLGFCTSCGR